MEKKRFLKVEEDVTMLSETLTNYVELQFYIPEIKKKTE